MSKLTEFKEFMARATPLTTELRASASISSMLEPMLMKVLDSHERLERSLASFKAELPEEPKRIEGSMNLYVPRSDYNTLAAAFAAVKVERDILQAAGDALDRSLGGSDSEIIKCVADWRALKEKS